MLHQDALWQMNQTHHDELLDEARRHRLLTQNHPSRLNGKGRLLLTIGEFFVAMGSRLKARYEPVTR